MTLVQRMELMRLRIDEFDLESAIYFFRDQLRQEAAELLASFNSSTGDHT